MDSMATIVRNTCAPRGAATPSPTFQLFTTPTPPQQRALQLLQGITV
jgi:hypothetical protein